MGRCMTNTGPSSPKCQMGRCMPLCIAIAEMAGAYRRRLGQALEVVRAQSRSLRGREHRGHRFPRPGVTMDKPDRVDPAFPAPRPEYPHWYPTHILHSLLPPEEWGPRVTAVYSTNAFGPLLVRSGERACGSHTPAED